jgi:Cu+-exporting ATPase
MPKIEKIGTTKVVASTCYHCGDVCYDDISSVEDKVFCCEGCKQVYLLLSDKDLCVYYDFDKNPGLKTKQNFADNRFAYLDDEQIVTRLAKFKSDTQINIDFYLPQMHCASCVYLLENLHKINNGIITSQVNFQKKELFISYNPSLISLKQVVSLLAFLGYEPTISLENVERIPKNKYNRKQIYKIGLAGFCFANIMMLSFPEYFSDGNIEQRILKQTFVWLSFFLSIPVLLYSASEFFISAYKGFQQKLLNIDAPIALAIAITYARSYYEIISNTGVGYLDSGTGIVFFMLLGRWFQNKTYSSLSFDRDYKSYFPLGITKLIGNTEKNVPITSIQKGDIVCIRNEEMIPVDGILVGGTANINYSFISGESKPVSKKIGDIIYAGGKQIGQFIQVQVSNKVSQSYITQLWNNDIFAKKKNVEQSFIHPWSKYFTIALFAIAIATLIFWWIVEPAKILPSVSAVLIVACPCSLLLSATFTFGNMLRIFGKNKLYLKNANVIEALAKIDTVVFDKTGTITHDENSTVNFIGKPLSNTQWQMIKYITKQSVHPLSKAIYNWLAAVEEKQYVITEYNEIIGKGIIAKINDIIFVIGSANFVVENKFSISEVIVDSGVYVSINNNYIGKFIVNNKMREGIKDAVESLLKANKKIYLLSGDNDAEKLLLENTFGKNVPLYFNKSPQQKLDFIKQLQSHGSKVLMIGDGLNDAGALMQSDVGIAISDNGAKFTPACDAILYGNSLQYINKFLQYANKGKTIVTVSFVLSILYNIVGLSFAVQGLLSPIIAAILMPASSISIVLLVTVLSSVSAKLKKVNG